MEGILQKLDVGLFNSWNPYYFILHDDILMFLDKKEGKVLGQIHLKVSKISSVQKDPLQIILFNGTSELLLRAKSIKEKVNWQNMIVEHQRKTNEGVFDQASKRSARSPQQQQVNSSFASSHDERDEPSDSMIKDPNVDWSKQLNLAFTSQLFKMDSPFFMKLGKVWEREAELEESLSFIEDEARKLNNKSLTQKCERINSCCNEMKQSITEVVEEIEENRREMFRVAKLIIQLRDQVLKKNGQLVTNLPQALIPGGGVAPSNKSVSDTSSQRNYMPNSFNLNMQSPEQKIHSTFKKQESSPLIERVDYQNQLLDSIGVASNHQANGNGKHKKNINSQIEEIKEANEDMFNSQHSVSKFSAMRGFGGIPVTYTMNMRDSLPFMTPEKQSFSIWAILKSSIGKDLSKISMPIWLNEPISMLQKVAECTQYIDILKRAMNEPDDCKRLALIAIFVMSQYGNVYQRTRKPFNPILGETYEIIQPDWRIVVEQVSHHPPISAFHLEGDGYHYYGNTNISNKFWGSSMEFKCIGLQHMYIQKYGNEHISIKRPDNSANNLIAGNIYVDVHGKMEVINHTKNLTCEINIERQGWTTRVTHKCLGKVKDSSGKAVYEIAGRWSEFLSLKNLKTEESEEVWRAAPKHPECHRYYYFGYYTMNLNYVNDDMLKTLPPTDCRRRMDQRLMEQGKYDEASQEKHRLEEKQRAQRKEREVMQIKYEPKYFIEEKDSNGDKEYKFTNTYWDKRKNGDWKDALDLY